MKIQCVILSAGLATRMRLIVDNVPKFMIPAWDIPLGMHLVKKIRGEGVRDFIIVLSPYDKIIWGAHLEQVFGGLGASLQIVVQDDPGGPGQALSLAVQISTAEEIFLILADTYTSDPINLEGDWVGLAPAKGDGAWCWVNASTEGSVMGFYDKTKPPEGTSLVACGLYKFSSRKLVEEAAKYILKNDIKISNEFQISSIMERYMLVKDLHVKNINEWLDFGSAFNYYENINKLLKSNKNVNAVEVIENKSVRKSSIPRVVSSEVDWFRSLGNQRPISPEVYDVDDDYRSYDIDLLEIPSLSYIYNFYNLKDSDFLFLMEHLMQFSKKNLWRNVAELEKEEMLSACHDMYISKTQKRLEEWFKHEDFPADQSLKINSHACPSMYDALELIEKNSKLLLSNTQWAFVHGDYNFSNIYYSRLYGRFKLVDPRGRFGEIPAHLGGDVCYDIAKLRHSYHGMYESFANDLFHIEQNNSLDFELKYPKKNDSLIERIDDIVLSGFDKNMIKLLELNLFISMLPLHTKKRAFALALRALEMARELELE